MTELTVVKNEIQEVQAQTDVLLDQLTSTVIEEAEQHGIEVHVVCDDQPEQTITVTPEMEVPVLFDQIEEPVVEPTVTETVTEDTTTKTITDEVDEPFNFVDQTSNVGDNQVENEFEVEQVEVKVIMDPYALAGGVCGSLTAYAVNQSVTGAVAGVVGGLVVSARNGKSLSEEGRLEHRSKIERAADFSAGFGTACTVGLLVGGLTKMCFGNSSVEEVECDEV